jgi:hypothetical protein
MYLYVCAMQLYLIIFVCMYVVMMCVVLYGAPAFVQHNTPDTRGNYPQEITESVIQTIITRTKLVEKCVKCLLD